MLVHPWKQAIWFPFTDKETEDQKQLQQLLFGGPKTESFVDIKMSILTYHKY